MSRRRLFLLALLVLILSGFLVTLAHSGLPDLAGSIAVLAQDGPPDLPRWLVAGGGGTSGDGSGLALSGAIGQAAPGQSGAGTFGLQGGFWAAAPGEQAIRLYLPVITVPSG
jgi:hypothetical protein